MHSYFLCSLFFANEERARGGFCGVTVLIIIVELEEEVLCYCHNLYQHCLFSGSVFLQTFGYGLVVGFVFASPCLVVG